jgi:tRNA(adenine34) deaminase
MTADDADAAVDADAGGAAGDERFMREALALAESAATQGEVPVGAVLVVDGKIVAGAANAPISRNDPTAHAEILALRAAGERVGNYRLPGTTLYVTLEPCPMCAAAMVHARVERLVYGAADPKTGAAGSAFDLARDSRLNHRIAVTGGVLAVETARLLQDFFRERRERG